jgi:Ran GTPase-activating protein (RanGAP) involved in mRNA processing and transport
MDLAPMESDEYDADMDLATMESDEDATNLIPPDRDQLNLNVVDAEDAKQLAHELENNTTLIDLSLCLDEVGHEGVLAVAAALIKNRALARFELRDAGGDSGATALAMALHQNTSLQELCLWRNSIGSIGASSLAAALMINTSLCCLHLDGSRTGHSDEDDNKIGDIGAVAIAAALRHNTSLTELSLHGNDIGRVGVDALAETLCTESYLKHLYLGANRLGDDGATAIACVVGSSKSLISLDLATNSIGDVGTAAVAHALKNQTGSLTELSLGWNSFGMVSLTLIAKALTENKLLRKIDLRYCNVGDLGAAALAKALRQNTTLQSLLADGGRPCDVGAKSILMALTESNTTLTEIQWPSSANASLSAMDDISAITGIVRANKAVSRLRTPIPTQSLMCFRIDQKRAILVAETLADNTALTTLVLNTNCLGGTGSAVIAKALLKNRTLERIEIVDNFIGDVGASGMAAALKVNTVLTKVSLTDNEIGLEGAVALASALKLNSSLKELELKKNDFGDGGAVAFADALKSNSTLMRLDLGHNNIGDEGSTPILKTLKEENCTLMFLNLKGNRRTAQFILKAVRGVLASRSAPCSRSLHAPSSRSHDPPHAAPEDADMILATMGSDEDATNGRQVQIPPAEERLDMDLSYDYFITESAKHRPNILESDTMSTVLQTGSEAAELVETPRQETSLLSLRRQDSRNYEGAKSAPIALTEGNATVTDLQLMGDINASSSVVSTVNDATVTASQLRCTGEKWDLASRNVDQEGARCIAERLSESTGVPVASLLVSSNRIGSAGCVDIANALLINRTLELMEMDHNCIGDIGALAIAAALNVNTVLTKLSLNGNKIGHLGAVALASALKLNSSLKELALGGNELGDYGAVAFANALKSNSVLARLNLGHNNIGDEGSTSILQALREDNCTLMFLNLEGNTLTAPVFLEAIKVVLASRRVIDFLANLEPRVGGAGHSTA